MRSRGLILGLLFLSVLSACGLKRNLSLPGDKHNGEQQTQSSPAPAPAPTPAPTPSPTTSSVIVPTPVPSDMR